MNKEETKQLLQKYHDGLCTQKEKAIIESWYNQRALLKEQQPVGENELMEANSLIWEQIMENSPKRKIVSFNLKRVAVAASIILCTGLGLYYYNAGQQQEQSITQQDFTPGKNTAILTLSNGRQIALTDAKNGRLTSQGNSTISKASGGQIIYQSGRTTNETMIYNTLSTPQGGQYHLLLADGTNIWLNAASSITYPTSFSGKERKVEITGEVYFEVAHNAAKPFRVKSNGQIVEVLGTHFNVNAYADENGITTTLLQGSVRVTANKRETILKPGNQTIVNAGNINVAAVDVDEAVSWKDGYFDFTDTDIKAVMRQLSRWYDADIQFKGDFTNKTFTGRIPRSWNLSEVMKMIQSSNSMHLSVEGRRIMVTP